MPKLMSRPGAAISPTGTMAPANSTCGKHSIGRASVAWAASATAADASSPSASAATDSTSSVTNGAAYVSHPRAGRRSRTRSTPSNVAATTASRGVSTATFDSTYATTLSPANRSRRKTATSPTIWSRPYVSPKKKPAKAIQNTICTGPSASRPVVRTPPGGTAPPSSS
jgi:hypothetical protein